MAPSRIQRWYHVCSLTNLPVWIARPAPPQLRPEAVHPESYACVLRTIARGTQPHLPSYQYLLVLCSPCSTFLDTPKGGRALKRGGGPGKAGLRPKRQV